MAVYLLAYGAAYLFARGGGNDLAGISLIAAALYLYWDDYHKSGNIAHLRGIFALSWVGGQGVACLKLSKLGMVWSNVTWLSFLLAFAGFWITFYVLNYYIENTDVRRNRLKDFHNLDSSVFLCACGITAVSLFSFLVEASILGYIPLFLKGVPHAYSYFHLTGIHYFTVSCVLTPSLAIIYVCINRGRDKGRARILAVATVVSLAIPILCVSRFQLIMAVFLAIITYMLADPHLNIWYALGALLLLGLAYVLLTIARSHDTAYLNEIFEMKNSRIPIFISQPYSYISNNYDNFNCLVEGLKEHSYGYRMLSPVWTFTGLKFFVPELTNFPVFYTKEEMTTLTLFYDAYYDFGLLGVFTLSSGLGALAYYLSRMLAYMRNPIGYLFYAQIAMYLLLSFFTTWFSNPTTWFYLGVTGIAAFVAEQRWGYRAKSRNRRRGNRLI